MWPLGRNTSRRKEIRRDKAERGLTWFQWAIEQLNPGAVTIAVATAFLAVAIINAGGDAFGYRLGMSLPRELTARVEVRIEDLQQTTAERLRRRETAPYHYTLDDSLLDDVRGKLTNALTIARSGAGQATQLIEEARKLKLHLDPDTAEELIRLANLPEQSAYQRSVDQALEALTRRPLVEPVPADAASGRTPVKAVLTDSTGARTRTVSMAEVLFADNSESVEVVADAASRAFHKPLRTTYQAWVAALLRGDDGQTARPLYRFDAAATAQAAEDAYASVSMQYLTYARGAVLADGGPIAAEELARLRAEQQAFRAAEASRPDPGSRWPTQVGRGLLAALISIWMAVHIWRYPPARSGSVLLRHVAIGALAISVLTLVRATYVGSELPAHVAVGGAALFAGLLGVVLSKGLVLGVCGGLAALVTLATQQGIGFVVVLLAVCATLVSGVRDVRSRGKIVAVGGLAGVVALLTSLADGLLDGQTLRYSAWQGAWAAGATLAAGFVVEGVLPGLERLFKFSTSITLLEWCDVNRPLLRMLAAEAPGTYNHSLLVGTLAEAAAEAIGANGLLARTGAYYHDIGKINKPEYFVENQGTRYNRHARLSPAMSLLIIIGHVKDGIEMAREYGLPASLHPFISEHHGTTLVEYFFHAANKARKTGEPEVAETEYRYPGPKPSSRETAIVMMCDGVEGAVRALDEPTPGRIEDVVAQIVEKRLLDGQFDECELTFADLAAIRRSLVKSLCSIYHARIEYPSATEPEEAPDEAPTSGATRHAS